MLTQMLDIFLFSATGLLLGLSFLAPCVIFAAAVTSCFIVLDKYIG